MPYISAGRAVIDQRFVTAPQSPYRQLWSCLVSGQEASARPHCVFTVLLRKNCAPLATGDMTRSMLGILNEINGLIPVPLQILSTASQSVITLTQCYP